ncbi:MAG: hypothetical protein HUU43_14550 [Ignavibacteriaceae bacterium]|nr:hypothetical protein [Ignavibacteriaceae bacterium]
MKFTHENLKDIKVSLFSNVMATDKPEQINLISLIERIKSNYYRNKIESLRALPETEYSNQKKYLPAFTLSVLCKHREHYSGPDSAGEKKFIDQKIIQYNPVIQVDIDDLEDQGISLNQAKQILDKIPYVWFYFTSPGGKGLKAGFLHNSTDHSNHEAAFNGMIAYLTEAFKGQVKIDHVKDVFRLFIVSHDPDAVIKPVDQIEFFQVPQLKQGSITPVPVEELLKGNFQEVKSGHSNEDSLIRGLTTLLNKSYDGIRHAQRLKAGFIAGGYIAGENLNESDLIDKLLPVIMNNTRLSENRAIKDFSDGIKAGRNKPLKFSSKKKKTPPVKKGSDSAAVGDGNNSAGAAAATPQITNERAALEFIQTKYKIYYNEITGREEIYSLNDEFLRPLEDRDFNTFLMQLKDSGRKISATGLKQVLQSDLIPVKNELKEYFEKCRNEFKAAALDYSPFEKFTESIEFENDESKDIFKEYFKRWMIWSLENLFRKHHFKYGGNPMMMIFHSTQHQKGKSTFFRRLLPDQLNKYYYEGDIHPENKDDKLYISTKFIYNLDEMGDFVKKDLSLLKKIITLPDFSQRLPYDKFSGERKRLCSFCGTSNNDQILTDHTGNRRFIIIGVKSLFDGIDYLDKERNLIWGEMYNEYLNGWDFKLSNIHTKQLNNYSEEFQVSSIEKFLIEEYFEPIKDPKEVSENELTRGKLDGSGNFWRAGEILNFFLNFEKTKELAKKTSAKNFGSIISALVYKENDTENNEEYRYIKARRQVDKIQSWGYYMKLKFDKFKDITESNFQNTQRTYPTSN